MKKLHKPKVFKVKVIDDDGFTTIHSEVGYGLAVQVAEMYCGVNYIVGVSLRDSSNRLRWIRGVPQGYIDAVSENIISSVLGIIEDRVSEGYTVVCDETNNNKETVNNNELWVDITTTAYDRNVT